MIALLLLGLAILGGVLFLALLLFLLTYVAGEREAGKMTENHSDTEQDNSFVAEKNDSPANRAVIHCAAYPPLVPYRYRAAGYTECNILNMVFGGNLSCTKGCLGLGSCALICPNDAILFRSGEVFISDACDGCGKCVAVCPKKLIEIVPHSSLGNIPCAATGNRDSSSLCPVALSERPYEIDYRNFPRSGFKILHK